MQSELIRIEPLAVECPECQVPLTVGQKKGVLPKDLTVEKLSLRAIAAKGCVVCHGKQFILTEAGERVRAALMPLIDYCVRAEVAKRLKELGFAADEPALVGADRRADGRESG